MMVLNEQDGSPEGGGATPSRRRGIRRLAAVLVAAVAFAAVAVPAQASGGRPDRVADVAAVSGGSPGEIVVTWDAHPDGAEDYRVAFKPADGKFQPASDTAWNVFPLDNSVTLTGLVPGAEYRVIVRARFAAGTISKWARPVSGFAADASPDESVIASAQSDDMTLTNEISPALENEISPALENEISPPLENEISPPLENEISPLLEEELQTSTQQALVPVGTVLAGLKFLSGYTKDIDYQGHYVASTPTNTNGSWWRLIHDGNDELSTLPYDGNFIKGFKSAGGFLIENSNGTAYTSHAYWLDSNGYIRYDNEYTGYKIDNNWDDKAYGYILQARCCTHLAFKNPLQMGSFAGYRMEHQNRDQYVKPTTISWPDQPTLRYLISDQGIPGGWQYHRVDIQSCGTEFFRVAAVYESALSATWVGPTSGYDSGTTYDPYSSTNSGAGYYRGPWKYIEWRNSDCDDTNA